jgi:putative salt-induced outer membrane protein
MTNQSAHTSLAKVATAALLGFTVAAQAADAKWDTSAGLGLTLTEGNSKTILGSANIESKGEYRSYAITLGATATYGEQTSVKNNEVYKVYGQYDRKISDRFYVFGRADYMHDAIADIEYRVKLSPGFGWHVVKNDKMTFDVELGPGYVFQRLGAASDSYATLRVGDRFSYKISKSARIWQSAEFIPEVSDFGNYIIAAELGVEAQLTEKMSLRSVLQDDYTAKPALGRQANDIRLITGVNYKF